jgi:hypothetical protein
MSYQEIHEGMRRETLLHEEDARREIEKAQLVVVGSAACSPVVADEIPRDASRHFTLYEIGQEAAALDALLNEMGGDISDDETADIIDEWLRGNESALQTKVDGYCALIREYSARANARKEEMKRLRALVESDENRAKRMKERLLRFFEDRDIQKLETSRFRVSAHSNGGLPPLIINEDTNPHEISDQFQRVEIDENAVREALNLGVELDFACYGARGTHLRIS